MDVLVLDSAADRVALVRLALVNEVLAAATVEVSFATVVN